MTLATAFQPKRGSNQKVTASTASAFITIGLGNKSLRVLNAGAVVGYFRTYKASDGADTCTTGDTPVAASGGSGSVLVIEKPQDHDTVCYLADSTTTVMHFQAGEGGI